MKTTNRNRAVLLCLALALPVLLNACIVTSIRPFYFDRDVVEVPDLLGRWSAGGSELRTLERSEDGYLWKVDDDGDETLLEATFFEFQGELFYDYVLHEDEFGDDDLLVFAVRTHSVARVRLEGDELRVEEMSYERLEKMLESEAPELDLDHARDPDDRIVLTGSTTELQGFLAWCLATEGCFAAGPDEVTVLKRRE